MLYAVNVVLQSLNALVQERPVPRGLAAAAAALFVIAAGHHALLIRQARRMLSAASR